MLGLLTTYIPRNKKLGLILLGAFFLRVIGITHGYPYIFNVDEQALVRSTLGLFFNWKIDHFDWPHFNYYFHFFFYFVFVKIRGLVQVLGLRNVLEAPFPILWNDPFVFYALSRFLNALFGTLTIIPVYLLGKEMFSKKIGLVAAALLAVLPFHVYSSHYAQQEPMLLFWLMWAILFAYRASVSKSIREFLLCGLFFALAVGVKYNAGLFTAILPAFVLIRLFSKKSWKKESMSYIKGVIIAGLICMSVFLLTNYRIVQDWKIFWSYEYGRGFLWQVKDNANPLSWSVYPRELFLQLSKIFFNTGITIFLLYFVGGVLSFSRTRKAVYVFLLFIFSFLITLYTAKFERATSHYYVPVYGLMAIVPAWFISNIKNRSVRNFLGILAISVPLLFSIFTVYKFLVPDTRRIVLDYVLKDRTFFEGTELSEVNTVNNLGLRRYDTEREMDSSDLLLSTKVIINDDRIELVKTVSNKLREGPVIYVYEVN